MTSSQARYTAFDPNEYPDFLKSVHWEYYQQNFGERLTKLALRADWTFPKQDKDRFGVKDCVYFFTAPSRPYWVKIGACKILARRLGEHRDTYGPGLHVVAFAITPDFLEMEEEFHRFFDPFRHPEFKASEWFDASIVLDWLRMYEQTRTWGKWRGPFK